MQTINQRIPVSLGELESNERSRSNGLRAPESSPVDQPLSHGGMNGLWYTEEFSNQIRYGLKVKETLFRKQSKYQLVELFDTDAYGPTLCVDGIYMTSVKEEHFYHEMIVHPALCTADEVANVLIIGGGDGGTAREVLRHPGVQNVVLCEIDGDVVSACKEFLPGHGAWDDPRLDVRIGDGVEFVKNAAADSFDIVLLDGSDPVGPAEGLFGRSFYQYVERILKPNGVFALQSESPIINHRLFCDIVKTLRNIFGNAHPYFGPTPIYAAGIWSWTFATRSVDHFAMKDERVARIEEQSKYYNRDIHKAAFALSQQLRRDLA